MRELLLSNKQWFPISLPTPHLQRVHEQANTSKADTTLSSSGCNEEASTSFNSSGYEFNPDTSYSADDLEVFLNLAKMAKNGHLRTMEHWLACTT